MNKQITEKKKELVVKKIFGIKTKDIQMGHPLRFIYPNKFR